MDKLSKHEVKVLTLHTRLEEPEWGWEKDHGGFPQLSQQREQRQIDTEDTPQGTCSCLMCEAHTLMHDRLHLHSLRKLYSKINVHKFVLKTIRFSFVSQKLMIYGDMR